MDFLTNSRSTCIGDILHKELRTAVDIVIAVAYFLPDETTLSLMKNVRRLRIVVSGEFNINNPDILNQLNSHGAVRCLSPEQNKFHAKVILGRRRNSSRFAILGSANLTYQGLFVNEEACLFLDSSKTQDTEIIDVLGKWLESIWQSSHKFDYKRAKAISDSIRLKGKSHRQRKRRLEATDYWILKTTEGSTGPSYWYQFVEERVIAIGWKELSIDPSCVINKELKEILIRTYNYTPWQSSIAANTIENFVNGMQIGDIVIICRGYPANADMDVFLYGIARITGNFEVRPSLDWKFIRDAEIQVVEEYLPKSFFTNTLRKNSLLKTIHHIEPEDFDRFYNNLHREQGILINI